MHTSKDLTAGFAKFAKFVENFDIQRLVKLYKCVFVGWKQYEEVLVFIFLHIPFNLIFLYNNLFVYCLCLTVLSNDKGECKLVCISLLSIYVSFFKTSYRLI